MNQSEKRNFSTVKRFVVIIAFFVLGFAIYANSTKVPFLFDDIGRIKDNTHIRVTRFSISQFFNAAAENKNRPLGNITFALNYFFHRYDVTGYHIVNITIHTLSAVFLYFGILATLNTPHIKNRYDTPEIIAFLSAMVWMVHPLHTQSVTYIVQRHTSLAGMFYILSLWLYAKGRLVKQGRKNWPWFLGSIFAGLLSLGAKETSVTLPFFVVLYEWFFFQDAGKAWFQRNIKYLIGVICIMGLIAFMFVGTDPWKIFSKLNAFSNNEFTYLERVFTQPRVVLFYISLLLYPNPSRLNLDHDFPLSHSLLDPPTTLLSLLIIAGIVGLAVFLTQKERLISFAVLWFFGNLLLESSFIPLDIIFEHRTYLPSMFTGLIAVILGFRYIKDRWLIAGIIGLAVATFSYWTYERNTVWHDGYTLWKDCVAKSPQKPRPHNNLGFVLAEQGRLNEAIEHYREALRINPDSTPAHNNLGIALDRQGKTEEAVQHYQAVLRLKPYDVKAYNNLGLALEKLGRLDEAIQYYRKALRINPDQASAHVNIGVVLAQQGQFKEAVQHLRTAVRIKPDDAGAYNNLANVLAAMGREKSSVGQYLKALEIDPGLFETYYSLGMVFLRMDKIDDAISSFQNALKLKPDFYVAKEALDRTLAARQKIDTDIAKTIRRIANEPQNAALYLDLGALYDYRGDPDHAAEQYRKALSIKPDFPEAMINLALVYMNRKAYAQSLSLFKKASSLMPENAAIDYNIACIHSLQAQPKTALGWLKKAVEKGFRNWDKIKTDPDLDHVRTSPAYRELIKMYE